MAVVSMHRATDPKAGGPIPRSTALAARGAPGLGCVSGRRDSREIHLPPSANVLVGSSSCWAADPTETPRSHFRCEAVARLGTLNSRPE